MIDDQLANSCNVSQILKMGKGTLPNIPWRRYILLWQSLLPVSHRCCHLGLWGILQDGGTKESQEERQLGMSFSAPVRLPQCPQAPWWELLDKGISLIDPWIKDPFHSGINVREADWKSMLVLSILVQWVCTRAQQTHHQLGPQSVCCKSLRELILLLSSPSKQRKYFGGLFC